MKELSEAQWDAALSQVPEAHLLQTNGWGTLKNAYGWRALRIADECFGAQILFRALPLGYSLAYLPKGPLTLADRGSDSGPLSMALWQEFWSHLDEVCRREKAIFLKLEPDLWQVSSENPTVPPGFRLSHHPIQPPRTLLVDLNGSEENILGRMKQKTRYNIRLALKKGVVVYPSSDIDTFHRLMLVTSERDRFGVHSRTYYQRAYELFHPRGECELLFAEFQGDPLAALMVFARGRRAWYFFGASSDMQRENMPTYLLQWEAMRWARNRGCMTYDLWGVPDADEDILEAGFTQRHDGLWGVYRFKRGFGGQLYRAQGPWDRVYNRFLYTLYSWWIRRSQVA